MSEMVQRAAAALRGVSYLLACEDVRARNRADPLVSPPDALTEHNQIMQEWRERQAHAVISAMREPAFDPEAVSYHEGMSRSDWWRSMIDAALTDEPAA